jgi:hypothetical protein
VKNWITPVPYVLLPTDDLDSFQTMPRFTTGLPLAPHPGGFGVQRKYNTHEGIDLYVPIGTPIFAVEDCDVVAVLPFTGPHAGLPWWQDTFAIFAEGPSGVVVYGEIAPHAKLGSRLSAGTLLGVASPVLLKDKGRPMCMLHLELHTHGSRSAPEWLVHAEPPKVLRDPTPFLLDSYVYK